MAIIQRFPEAGTGVTMPAKKSATKSRKAKKAATRKVASARKAAARKPAAKPKAKAKAKPKAKAKAKAKKVARTAKTKAPARAKTKAKAAPAKAKAKSKAKPRSVAKAKVAASRTSAKPARSRKPAATRKTAAKRVTKTGRKAPAKAPVSPGAAPKGPAKARAKAGRTAAARAVAVPRPRRAEEAVAEDEEGYDAEGPHNLLLGPRNVKPYIERRGEAYMGGEQLDHFRNILASWKRDLMEEVDRTMTHMKDEAANPPDPNDRATLESEFALELRTRDRERKLIRKIDEALKRIDDGSYGYCLETGEPIGVKRLEARPVATLCIEAQERRERREKQYGDRDDWYR